MGILKNRLVAAVVGFVGAILMVLAALLVWLSSYPLDDPKTSQAVYQAALKRIQDRQKEDPQQNGYTLMADMLSQAGSNTPPAQACAAFQDLTAYEEPKMLEDLKKDPVATKAAADKFRTVLPLLLEAAGRPSFHWPNELDQGFSAAEPDLLVLRRAAQGLNGMGHYMELQGKPAEAMRLYLAGLDLGARAGWQGPLIRAMISTALVSIQFQPLLRMVGEDRLKPADYRELLGRLEAVPLKPESMVDVLDEEYVFEVNGIDVLIVKGTTGPGITAGSDWVLHIKPYWEREKRITTNIWIHMRLRYAKLEPPNNEQQLADAVPAGSFFAKILIPSVSRSVNLHRRSLSALGAVQVMAALQLYRADHKIYPDKLGALVPAYLKVLPVDYLGKSGEYVYHKTARGFELGSGGDYIDRALSYAPYRPW